jgi:hypothetical protein
MQASIPIQAILPSADFMGTENEAVAQRGRGNTRFYLPQKGAKAQRGEAQPK